MRTIRLLGGAGVLDSDGSAAARPIQRSRMALLALLALSRTRSASRERLMALLWPESDAIRARNALKQIVHVIRRELGDDALVSVGDEVRLDPAHIACDVWMFEDAVQRQEWEEADRVYAGPLLDGVFLSEAAAFERWVDGERARLAALHERALEALASARAARGDLVGAVELLRRRSCADPHNTRVALRLMEALDASGDRAGALRHAAAHAALLESELNASPDPAVAAFAEQLRRDPAGSQLPIAVRHPVDHPPSQERTHAQPSESASGTRATDAEPALDALANGSRVVRVFPGRRLYGACALAVVLVLLGAGLYVRGRAVALDPDRIAVLPFRTSGADPALAFLRDGLSELLAVQFNGELGPVSVDPGEVLRVASGPAASEPPTPAFARRVASRLKAGQVIMGAVVGTPQRFTVTAFVVDLTRDGSRAAPVAVAGSLDLLPAMVAELSTKLLAGNTRVGRLSAEEIVPADLKVLRSYLRGMAEYRKGNWFAAGRELFQTVELDSMFVPAAYRFVLIHAIVAPTTPLGEPPSRDERFTRLYQRLWNQRERLIPDHRRLLEAVADSLYALWPNQALPRLEQVVKLLPNSVEAWDILGNDYYHAGALLGIADWKDRAARAFRRAMELDAGLSTNAQMHLADLAFLAREARAHARHAPTPRLPRGPAYMRYQSAILDGNAAFIARAREAYASAWARGDEDGMDWALRGLTMSSHELDSLLRQLEAGATTSEQRAQVAQWSWRAAFMEGRPAQGAAALRDAFGADSIAIDAALLDAGVDIENVERRLLSADARMSAHTRQPPLNHPIGCEVALSRLGRRDTSGVAAILATEPRLDRRLPALDALRTVRRGLRAQAAICAEVLDGILSARPPAGESLLLRADSMMQHLPLSYGAHWNYDIARAFAERHEYAAAAAAVRRRFHDLLPEPKLVAELRDEGRWAALAGDRAGAIRAYRDYLAWRGAPEPPLIPQRDSVRAELAALEKSNR